LGSLDEEVSNNLGDGVSHVSEDNLEIGIDSCSDFSNEEVAALLFALEYVLIAWLAWATGATRSGWLIIA